MPDNINSDCLFREGCRVFLIPGMYSVSHRNPVDIEGTIHNTDRHNVGVHWSSRLPTGSMLSRFRYLVLWDNGMTNEYREGELRPSYSEQLGDNWVYGDDLSVRLQVKTKTKFSDWSKQL